MKKSDLLEALKSAKYYSNTFIIVAVLLPGAAKPEYITNPIDNFENKAAYYDKAYNDDLELINNPAIKIIDFKVVTSSHLWYLISDLHGGDHNE